MWTDGWTGSRRHAGNPAFDIRITDPYATGSALCARWNVRRSGEVRWNTGGGKERGIVRFSGRPRADRAGGAYRPMAPWPSRPKRWWSAPERGTTRTCTPWDHGTRRETSGRGSAPRWARGRPDEHEVSRGPRVRLPLRPAPIHDADRDASRERCLPTRAGRTTKPTGRGASRSCAGARLGLARRSRSRRSSESGRIGSASLRGRSSHEGRSRKKEVQGRRSEMNP